MKQFIITKKLSLKIVNAIHRMIKKVNVGDFKISFSSVAVSSRKNETS